MKKILMACTLLALTAGFAHAGAGGLNLGWDDCGGLPASLNKASTCTSNAGINTLIGSFVAPSCVNAMSANEIVMDVQPVADKPVVAASAGACVKPSSSTKRGRRG